jgi:hypothetical protein
VQEADLYCFTYTREGTKGAVYALAKWKETWKRRREITEINITLQSCNNPNSFTFKYKMANATPTTSPLPGLEL